MIIYDTIITGHHVEYLVHLIKYLKRESNKNDTYYFIVNTNFLVNLKEMYCEKIPKNIKLIEITIEEQLKVDSKNIFIKSINNYRLLNKYIKELKVKNVLLMYFNLFQLPLIFLRPNIRVSGILFLQLFRIKKGIRYYIKYVLTFLYVKNPSVFKIYLLNDQVSVDKFNKVFTVNKFEFLPDPVNQNINYKNIDVKKYFNIDYKREIILHFGALGNRKGTLEFIQSAKYVSQSILKKTVFMIVGKPDSSEFHDKIIAEIREVKNYSKMIEFIYEGRFIGNDLMENIFAQSHIVVLPYKTIETSSGVLGHALKHGKKIIITGKGLLKDLLFENKLGYLIDEVSPISIANELNKQQFMSYDNIVDLKYLEQYDPNNFAKKLLDNEI